VVNHPHNLCPPSVPSIFSVALPGTICVMADARRLTRRGANSRRIFTERVPELIAAYARKTQRLVAVLQAIGVALGGQAGARLTRRLRCPASRDTLLWLVRRLPLPAILPLMAIGVDDRAHRKCQCYGTIIVDLTDRRPVALLHDHEADTLASWLREHVGITVIARDWMKTYIDGARVGAPQATQMADRFHLLQNPGRSPRSGLQRPWERAESGERSAQQDAYRPA
jgi:Transposase